MIELILCYVLIGFIFAMDADKRGMEALRKDLVNKHKEYEYYKRFRGLIVTLVALIWPIRALILTLRAFSNGVSKTMSWIND